jgi:tRNA threonylcarbamoyladenosine biosynthesis protein TsaB
MELAIDTSTDFAGVALTDEGKLISEFTWHSGQNHTIELIPNIDMLFKQKNLDIKSIGVVFVANGPGSFNGLRVGLSSAKGFASALNIPIIAVSTLEVEAISFAYTGLPLCPIHNVGRGEIAVALYQQTTDWQCLEIEHITNTDALINNLNTPTIFCGEIPQSVIEQIQNNAGSLAIIPDSTARLRRPCYLAKLGWQRFLNGQKDDPLSLQPIYLRQPPITQSKTKIIRM